VHPIARRQRERPAEGRHVFRIWQIPVRARRHGFHVPFADGARIAAIEDRHDLVAADLQQEVVLRIAVIGRDRLWRRDEHERLTVLELRRNRADMRRDFLETLVEQRLVLRVPLHVLEHHPGLAILDLPHRLVDRQSITWRGEIFLLDRKVGLVVFD